MPRRLFFIFPSAEETGAAVTDVLNLGIPQSHLHALAREGVDLSNLPQATHRQRRGVLGQIAHIFWYSELGIFFLALAGFILTLFWGFSLWSFLALMAMAITLFTGAYYAIKIPETTLDEFHSALAHKEVLLMVDVPMKLVAEIETYITHRHPAAIAGGSSWTIDAFGV